MHNIQTPQYYRLTLAEIALPLLCEALVTLATFCDGFFNCQQNKSTSYHSGISIVFSQ